MAFNSKNLAYESRVPAFLQRLKAEVGGNTVDRPNPRPRKAPREDDEEDEPTYVTEGNETISKEEFLAMNEGTISETAGDRRGSSDQQDTKEGVGTSAAKENTKEKGRNRILEVGKTNQKKRKAVKVVGSEDESVEPSDSGKPRADGGTKGADEAKEKPNSNAKKQKKQKKVAVKLSFGDDGE